MLRSKVIFKSAVGAKESSVWWLILPIPPDYFGIISVLKTNVRKIFQGEMFIKTSSTILLQIVSKLMLRSKVIFKSAVGAKESSVWWQILPIPPDYFGIISVLKTMSGKYFKERCSIKHHIQFSFK